MITTICNTFRGRCRRLVLHRSASVEFVTSRGLSYSTNIQGQTLPRTISTISFSSLKRARHSHIACSKQHSNFSEEGERNFSTSTRKMSRETPKKDWSATQYLKFNNERTRPVHDLVSQIAEHITSSNPRIYDLGCGPGNSAKVILDAFPGAKITGIDSSPDMLSKASAYLPDAEFLKGDLSTFSVKDGEKVDLLFSNAAFHWLRSPTRIETLTRLFLTLKPGGVLAFQIPDNYDESSHKLMREVAKKKDTLFYKYFDEANVGELENKERPDLDPIESRHTFYNALAPHASSVNIWRTEYQHVLKDAGAIVEWVKSTGLQPFLHRIEDDNATKAFLEEYERRLQEDYKSLVDGKVLLGYPRLFLVAVRK